MENDSFGAFILGILLTTLAFWLFKPTLCDPNSEAIYKNGYPVNCRALIQANIDGVNSKEFTCYEAMNSITRNCGINGNIWRKK